jgi:hypothetical protein
MTTRATRITTMKQKEYYSMNRFINKHGDITKKKKRKNVTICEWSPKLDMPKKGNRWEELLYNNANQTVFNLLTMKLGMYRLNGKRFRTKGFRIDEMDFEGDNFTLAGGSDFANAFDEEAQDWISLWDKLSVMENLIMPMASAIIHRTPFLSRIKKFQCEIEEYSSHLREIFLGCNFWRLVQEVVIEDYERRGWGDFESEEFQDLEKSGWSHNVGHLFLLFLDSHKAKLLGVIEEVEYLNQRIHVASVEDIIKKRVWEALVVDWVRKQGDEEDYIRLYESEGALRWYLDFVIPERQLVTLH